MLVMFHNSVDTAFPSHSKDFSNGKRHKYEKAFNRRLEIADERKSGEGENL